MKVKERLFICYHCKTKSKKEELFQVYTGKFTKQGVETYRYYHSECKVISELNKKNKERKTIAYSNESEVHLGVKEKIYGLIKSDKLKLVNQYGSETDFNNKAISVMEAPVTLQHNKVAPYYSEGSCESCIDSFGLNDYDKCTLNERILNCRESEGVHPCIKCPFNKLKYISIFDIGIIENGKYIDAIEVLHTSKIKKYKLDYCIKNRIKLYEIDYDTELSESKVECVEVWWKDNEGKIMIADRYKEYYF